MTDLPSLVADLRSEHESLDSVVADLPAEGWTRPTASPGWSVADQIGHLTYFDGTATLAITAPDRFQASFEQLLGAGDQVDELTLFRSLGPDGLLEKWRENRAGLLDAAGRLEDAQRIPWYGPSMGAKSFLTARLMECWAHGTDVVDAVGGHRPATGRLRHIAQLGYITRGWTYANRSEEMPAGEVRVELEGPDGGTWAFGPDDAPATVRGPAEHFCLVVTQRRHLDDTDLVVEGDIALDWMAKAQAYAGSPTEGPAPRGAR
ncbi:TIGR03084 family protein [Iamia sp. SCSIO 61187]|uniref:TIGR03084 family metal-binding protein n=1 Tax=Iamia sp. SCSIO 61187 TaxID=2722752 RepID=UPI001C630EBE|nr:TIGR03084 family metal-binding protein [Iamia sp. SCSIO 61187]QYG94481.1 TIGR03084 family protein [Iamia sp. SCSIO 61187]